MFDALHNLKGGQYAIVALVVQIIVAGMGGFLFNAQTVTSCNTDFTYVTDVYGAFKGSDQDIEVEYNPVENVTGYSGVIPEQESPLPYQIPGIIYTESDYVNQYPVSSYSGTQTELALTLTSTKDPLQWDPSQDTNTINMSYDEESFDNLLEKGFFGHYQSGNTSPEIGVTKLTLNGDHYRVQGIDLYTLATTIWGHTHENTDLYIVASNTSYPNLIAGVSYSASIGPVPDSSFSRMVYTLSYETSGKIGFIDQIQATVTIGDKIYNLRDVYYVWGESDDVTDTCTIIDTHQQGQYKYINPALGVAPAYTSTTETVIITETTYSNRAGGVLTIAPQASVYTIDNLGCTATAFFHQPSGATSFTTASINVLAQYGADACMVTVTVSYQGVSQQFDWTLSVPSPQNLPPVEFTFIYDLSTYTLNFWKGAQTIEGASPSTSSSDWLGYSWMLPDYNGERYDYMTHVLEGFDQTPRHYYDYSWNLVDATETTRQDHGSAESTGDSHLVSSIITYGEVTHTEEITVNFPTTYWDNRYSVATYDIVIDTSEESMAGRLFQCNYAFDQRKDGETKSYWTDAQIALKRENGSVYVSQDRSHWTDLGQFDHVQMTVDIHNGTVTVIFDPIYQWGTFTDYTPSGHKIAWSGLNDYIVGSTAIQQNGEIKAIRYISYENNISGMGFQPRHLVTRTLVFLSEGGLYKQDGVLNVSELFPGDNISELVISSVVRPGQALELYTAVPDSPGQYVMIYQLETDGVSKWVRNGISYDWYDVKFFYVSNHVPGTEIDGKQYGPGMYLNGTQLAPNSVYVQFGKYGNVEKIMGLTDGVLAYKMTGVWAFTTQYSVGENVQGTHIEIGTPGQWQWSQQEFLIIFIGVMIGALAIMTWKFGVRWLDLAIGVGQMAICWVMLG